MSDQPDPAARQRHILQKLETLWAAHPERTLADLLDRAIQRVQLHGISFNVGDALMEDALDRALAAESLTVSGGWKS